MLTKLAMWWLRRRGYTLVEPGFCGLVLGHCIALRRSEEAWTVLLPYPHAPIIALNQSVVQKEVVFK